MLLTFLSSITYRMVEQTKAIFMQENIEDVANGTLLSIHARYFILIFKIGFHFKKISLYCLYTLKRFESMSVLEKQKNCLLKKFSSQFNKRNDILMITYLYLKDHQPKPHTKLKFSSVGFEASQYTLKRIVRGCYYNCYCQAN